MHPGIGLRLFTMLLKIKYDVVNWRSGIPNCFLKGVVSGSYERKDTGSLC